MESPRCSAASTGLTGGAASADTGAPTAAGISGGHVRTAPTMATQRSPRAAAVGPTDPGRQGLPPTGRTTTSSKSQEAGAAARRHQAPSKARGTGGAPRRHG
eukprot:7769262-Lingulodinium_polyedra.AAC.1